MALAKLSTLVSTFPGPGLPPEWISNGSPASVVNGSVQIPAATDFATRISTVAFYDPTNSSIYGKLALSTPRSYTTTPAPPAFTGYNRIGAQQPGGTQCKVLNGVIPGFTVGQQAHGQMKPTMDNLATLIGTQVEAVGVGLPNQFQQGDASKVLDALSGETRFIRFNLPLVPLATHSGEVTGSITDLLNGVYDAGIIAICNQMVAAGFAGDNVSISLGNEYNSGRNNGVLKSTGFPWSTGFPDPRTGTPNTMAFVHQGQAYFENLLRAHGYTGYIEWNGGTQDTSADPITSWMPTHATTWKSKTLAGWDIYPGIPYGAGKTNITAAINQINTIYNTYLAWCQSHGYLMAHGEYGMIYNPQSPYTPIDNVEWFAWFYKKLADNAKWVAYAMFYQQNQPYTPGTVLDESHQLWFWGGRQGVPSTTVGTSDYPTGQTDVNQKGTANTAALIGTLHNVSDSGVPVFTNDPNKAKALSSWMQNFGGGYAGVTGKGAAGLGVPYVVPASPTTTGPKAQIILTPGGSHNPPVGLLMEFDYDKTQNAITINYADDGTGVNTAAAPNVIWWRIRDDGANVHWETSTDASTWTNLRTAARPAWWNATDGVQVQITSHNDDGTQTISPLVVSNINNTSGTSGTTPGTDIAIFDKYNISSAPPAAVQGLLSHVDGNTVALTWGAPAQGVVQGYIVTATPLNISSPNLPSQTVTSTAATFLNVPAGSSYVFTVVAFNSAGQGAGVATAAVSITATGNTGGSGGVPTPAYGGLTPNALPIQPVPALYTPLTLTTGADDGDTLANAAISRLASLMGNNWRPYLANPEVAALQVAAYFAADLRTLVKAVGAEMFSAYGQELLQNPQRGASSSVIITTWTALDANGYTVPEGTQVAYTGSGSTPLTFTVRGDFEIPNGETQATGIVMISDQVGAYTNSVPVGPLEVQGSLIWLDSVEVTTAATNGADAESDDDYRNRLVSFVRSLGQTLVLPSDFSIAAQQASSAVYRALTIPGYDANSPSDRVDRTVSVFLLGPDGLPVAPDVASDVYQVLQAKRETNFRVVVLNGSNNAISPTYVNVAITATVVTATGFAQADVKAACETALKAYIDPSTWEGGRGTPPIWTGKAVIRPHDLAAVLTQVPGVDHVDSLHVGGGVVAISGTDNYTLSPTAKAVLPAGTYTGSHWTTPSSVTVTANAPAV